MGPLPRWLALLGLLLAEGLVLAVRFDSGTLSSLPAGWWTPILDLTGSVMPAALMVFVALLLVGWSKAREWSADSLLSHDSPRRYIPYLGLHLLAFGALYGVSLQLFRTAARRPGELVALWLLTVAVTVGTWLGTLLPPRVLVERLRARAALLAGSVALGFLAFGLGQLTEGLWNPLRRVTFKAASSLLRMTSPSGFVDPDRFTFGTPVFAVQIAPQCSGYEGIGLTGAFTLAALWLFRNRFRFPQAFLLLVPALILPWLANAARLVALVLVGTYVSPELAKGGFHSYAGSILFCGVALGIVATGLRSAWLSRVPQAQPGAAAPYLLPFLAITAAGLVSRSLSTPGSEPFFALRPIAAMAALLCFWRTYRGMTWRISGLAVGVGVAVAAVWLLLERWFPAPSAGSAPAGISVGVWVLRLATAILIVPVVEELGFRGFFARRLASTNFELIAPSQIPWQALALSSLAFALLHQRTVPALVAGLSYGWVYRRRGNLSDAIVAHAVTNLVLGVAAAMMGSRDLWR